PASTDRDLAHLRRLGDLRRHMVVALVVRILRPAVELPVRGELLAVLVLHDDRARVARPDAVGRDREEGHARKVRALLYPARLRLLRFSRVLDADADALAPPEHADDLGVGAGAHPAFPGPVFVVPRPADPCGAAGPEAGGHPITTLTRPSSHR